MHIVLFHLSEPFHSFLSLFRISFLPALNLGNTYETRMNFFINISAPTMQLLMSLFRFPYTFVIVYNTCLSSLIFLCILKSCHGT